MKRDEIYKKSMALQGKELQQVPLDIQTQQDKIISQQNIYDEKGNLKGASQYVVQEMKYIKHLWFHYQNGNIPIVPDIEMQAKISPHKEIYKQEVIVLYQKGNYYDDKGPTFKGLLDYEGKFALGGLPQGLGYVDVFAAAHQLRGILREFGVLSDPSIGKRTGDRIVKGITWAVSQFLLTAMNPSGLELGAGNFIWNPLGVAASFIPLARATSLGTSPLGSVAVGEQYNAQIAGADMNVCF